MPRPPRIQKRCDSPLLSWTAVPSSSFRTTLTTSQEPTKRPKSVSLSSNSGAGPAAASFEIPR
jgi:hypothetical protein